MRDLALLYACPLALASSCAELKREKLKDIGGTETGAAYVLYRSSGLHGGYLTIESPIGDRGSAVSISSCKVIAARKADSRLDVIAFDAKMSVGNLDTQPPFASEIRIVAHDREPSSQEVQSLLSQGFTTLDCSGLI